MWTDVMNLNVTEFNSTSAEIRIGFYPIDHDCQPLKGNAHAVPPGDTSLNGDIHIRADIPFSAFSYQGREFEMHGLLKVVCL